MDISKILVPVDFSDASEKAFDYALNFREYIGSEISILHSLVIYQDMHEEIVNFKDFQKFIDIRITTAENKLRKYVEKASAHGAAVDTIIVKGLSAADSISQYLS
ncbi:MAG: universal stress protein, partial [Calditrichia bacterium]